MIKLLLLSFVTLIYAWIETEPPLEMRSIPAPLTIPDGSVQFQFGLYGQGTINYLCDKSAWKFIESFALFYQHGFVSLPVGYVYHPHDQTASSTITFRVIVNNSTALGSVIARVKSPESSHNLDWLTYRITKSSRGTDKGDSGISVGTVEAAKLLCTTANGGQCLNDTQEDYPDPYDHSGDAYKPYPGSPEFPYISGELVTVDFVDLRFFQRVFTLGGQTPPPSECGNSSSGYKNGQVYKSPFTSQYWFYG